MRLKSLASRVCTPDDLDMIEQLSAALDRWERDPDVELVLLPPLRPPDELGVTEEGTVLVEIVARLGVPPRAISAGGGGCVDVEASGTVGGLHEPTLRCPAHLALMAPRA